MSVAWGIKPNKENNIEEILSYQAQQTKLVDTIVALTVDSNHGREVLPPLLNKM